MTLWRFIIANLKMTLRNKQGLFWTFFLPVLIMVIFGLVNFESVATAGISVIDQARNDGSKQFVESLKKIDALKVSESNDLAEEKIQLEKGQRDLILVLPSDFLAYKGPPQPQKLMLYYNESQPQNVQTGVTVLRESLNMLGQKITNTKEMFLLEQKSVSARNIKYINFLVPGIIALSIMQMGVFAIVFALVSYREKGVMRRLLVTPLKPLDFVGSMVATRVLVSFLQSAIIVVLAVLLFKIEVYGSYALLALFVLLGSIVFLSLGFIISGLAKTEEAAAPIANVIVMPMMFLGNVFFPASAMPEWLRNITQYLPVAYLADALRKIMNEAAHFSDLTHDLYGLLVWAAILMIIAMFSFRYSKTE